jgi:hypothetical protein
MTRSVVRLPHVAEETEQAGRDLLAGEPCLSAVSGLAFADPGTRHPMLLRRRGQARRRQHAGRASTAAPRPFPQRAGHTERNPP